MRQLAATILAITLTCVSAVADTFYVDASRSDDSGDGTSWATAKKTIQGGVDVASANDTVLVTNGTYDTGRTITPGRLCSNRVVIAADITVESVNGPDVTFIVGAEATGGGCGDDAVRGVYMTAGTLSGFTVTNGHTMNTGGGAYDRGGGGVNMILGGTVTNCVLSGNSANDGGGSYRGTLDNCTLSGNTADYWGGGSRESTLNNCTLSGNSAGDGGGGSFKGTLSDCVITNNSTTGIGSDGGGSHGSVLSNCAIVANSAVDHGGGTYDATLTNCGLTNNTAGGYGGGTYGGVLTDCTIVGNSATGESGGGTCQATLTNCVLRGNTAYNLGGGCFQGTLHNCLITDNAVTNDGGGCAQADLYNCTIVDNTADDRGGGTHGGVLRNCIIYFNTAVTAEDNYRSASVLTNCCTTPDPGGTGNITDDPQFVDADSDYRLQNGSACVDAGSNAFVSASTDLDGNTRIVGDAVDMGAYENQGATLVVLYGFEVGVAGNRVVVRWKTASETRTLGFRLYRRLGAGSWTTVGDFIEAKGWPDGGTGAEYSVIDPDAVPGETYTYKLVEHEGDGGTEEYGPFERQAFALKITSPFAVTDAGVVLRWLSRGNETYRLLRATNLSQSAFDIRRSAIPATPPENVYTDALEKAGTVFYRIEVDR